MRGRGWACLARMHMLAASLNTFATMSMNHLRMPANMYQHGWDRVEPGVANLRSWPKRGGTRKVGYQGPSLGARGLVGPGQRYRKDDYPRRLRQAP